MGRVCVGRLCYGPSLQWAEFAMGRDVQLPSVLLNTSRQKSLIKLRDKRRITKYYVKKTCYIKYYVEKNSLIGLANFTLLPCDLM